LATLGGIALRPITLSEYNGILSYTQAVTIGPILILLITLDRFRAMAKEDPHAGAPRLSKQTKEELMNIRRNILPRHSSFAGINPHFT
jgi:hypothetical protein